MTYNIVYNEELSVLNYIKNKVENLKIAYIGGGSRGWAWNLMSDLAQEKQLGGKVYLYDIDTKAAKNNEIIGNSIRSVHSDCDNFEYVATDSLADALVDADFVVISILPGTFDEMEVDVHEPEKYGIYQSVGDTAGPGGTLRALRTLPMFEEFALAIKQYCPHAWVINYTNPMTVCMRMLYKTFPEIRAFGCCHEVFGTQKLLAKVLEEQAGISDVKREDIKVNVIGINHFTWLTKANYRSIDLFPLYKSYCERNLYSSDDEGKTSDENWLNSFFESADKVKMDLFLRYGSIAAAGDRHLAEFCPGGWYLKDPETVKSWGFVLTPVSWRKENRADLIKKSERLVCGEEKFELKPSGEEGVLQMKALLGLGDLVTNVNIPNYGQIPNLPLGVIVETNARFSDNSVTPVFAGEIPHNILGLIERVVSNQELIVKSAKNKDLDHAFTAFINDNLNPLSLNDSKHLFNTMAEKTAHYLTMYKTRSV